MAKQALPNPKAFISWAHRDSGWEDADEVAWAREVAAGEQLASPPVEQIARAQIALGEPSIVRFQDPHRPVLQALRPPPI
jgi:hypothetical protein